MFLSSRTGVFAKSAFLGLIYDKAIKLKNSGNQSAGEVCYQDSFFHNFLSLELHYVLNILHLQQFDLENDHSFLVFCILFIFLQIN